VSNYLSTSIRWLFVILCLAPGAVCAVSARTVNALVVIPPTPVIVIGFVGGFVRHDAMAHSAVQIAADLRKEYLSGVHTEVLENRRREKAHADILRLVDTDRDGTLSSEEKKNARIILYGHSWGAAAAIMLARELGTEGIPVLLTVQVDSVSKPGQNDKVIPTNVAEAVNFYQRNGFLHGQSRIRAADPARTHILGNFRFDYRASQLRCRHYPWYDRLFMKPHIQIECDPKVWSRVESLIESKLPPPERVTGENQPASTSPSASSP
jgi:pimeloyl-ACP methyl ester carboxylesterase